MPVNLINLRGPDFWQYPLTGKSLPPLTLFQQYIYYPQVVVRSGWQLLVDRIYPLTTLRKEIAALVVHLQADQPFDDTKREMVLNALSSPEFDLMAPHVKIILHRLPPKVAADLLIEGLQRGLVAANEETGDLNPLLNLKVFELFTLEEMLTLATVSAEKLKSDMTTTRQGRKDYISLPKMDEDLFDLIYTKISVFFHQIIDLLLTIFLKYANIWTGWTLTTKEQRKEGAHGLDKLVKLLWLLLAFFTLFPKLVTEEWLKAHQRTANLFSWGPLIIILLIVLSPILLSIKSYFDKRPESVEGFDNLNRLAEEGEFNYLLGYENEMIRLIPELKERHGVLLQGAEGTSKHLIVKALVKQMTIARALGERKTMEIENVGCPYPGIDPDFAKRTVFEIDLKEHKGSAKELLERFTHEAGHFSNEVIVFIDHIETLWGDTKALKALVDLQKHFPYCIFGVAGEVQVTDFEKMAQVSYEPIPENIPEDKLTTLTGILETQLLEILKNYARKIAPGEQDLSDEILRTIINRSGAIHPEQKIYRPARATALLSAVLKDRAAEVSSNDLEEFRRVEMARAVKILSTQNSSAEELTPMIAEMEKSEKESQILRKKLKTQIDKVNRLHTVQELLRRAKAFENATAIWATDETGGYPLNEANTRRYAILNKFLLPAIEEGLKTLREETKAWTEGSIIDQAKIERQASKLFPPGFNPCTTSIRIS